LRSSYSRTPPTPMLLRPEDCWAPGPFCLYVSMRAAWPCKETVILFHTFAKAKQCSLIYRAILFLLLSE
jgi:hypothetical protein